MMALTIFHKCEVAWTFNCLNSFTVFIFFLIIISSMCELDAFIFLVSEYSGVKLLVYLHSVDVYLFI